jgi:hypothetical protein
LQDEISTGDVATNTAKGHIDVVGGKCPKGQVYDKIKKVCVPKLKEDFVYIYNKKKNKRIKILNNPELIKKYEKKGYVVETSVVGGSYIGGTTTNIVGSGQTRVWGVKRGIMTDLARKEPVTDKRDDPAETNILGRKGLKFDKKLGAYVPSLWSEDE